MILRCLNQKMDEPVNFQIIQWDNHEKRYHDRIFEPGAKFIAERYIQRKHNISLRVHLDGLDGEEIGSF